MQIRELSVPDAWEIKPQQHRDDRGAFLEWYRFDLLQEAIGHPLNLRQANTSISRKGVVRGIHFADVPPGQAKYVTANSGAVMDYVVDIRVGSATFGAWDRVLLDSDDRRAVYIAEGLGHLFVALTEGATVSYLVSDTYRPGAEHGIHPLDPEIGLEFPEGIGELILSDKDRAAPTLEQAKAEGLLPNMAEVAKFYETLNEAVKS
ncbi:MAG: dTDP-4-dehydrorhamnose 3,5-epimerase family protein [Cryobacterium sp.]|nr:dTDP-4-dehydrorhamnose 3,5-epimerase family protein [Cryobacterium sp.]